ncbi:hypothetical protein FNF28_00496 [Cafeteria roenbergensis]|uniref:Amino acid permease/ SLC12A domain-containing protein n=1 Tax=Cafeteria roenbergensis TaxID=33653 RepID=A0A5A8E7L2_CAFRO|nr:hypothetical protein FNF28_00496 [Cafeteria roenbergensis]
MEQQPATAIFRRASRPAHEAFDLATFKKEGTAAPQASQSAGRDGQPSSPAAGGGAQSPQPSSAASAPQHATPQSNKLGWSEGVLVPVLLNIWGVILFLRLSWVVGQAGIAESMAIVLMANSVTFLTTLSLSAITTNGVVQGGGAYFVISRNLGPQFGGAIGLLFFVAQAIATSLYVVGFAESVVDLYRSGSGGAFTGDYGWDQRVIGLATCAVLLGMALIGVGWVAKSQIFLLIILVATILAVLIGAFFPAVPSEATNASAGFLGFASPAFADNVGSSYIVDPKTMTQQSLFSVFSVFFPAVTGIMAGANMSGDLRDPSRAIPKGTLLGIGISLSSYIALLWFIGGTVARCTDPANTGFCDAPDFGSQAWAARLASDPDAEASLGGLLFDNLIVTSISLWGPLVYAGIFAATLSSALASLVGAPRILQALSKDRLFDFRWFFYFSQLPFPADTSSTGATDELGRLQSTKAGPVEFGFYHPVLAGLGALLCVVLMFAFDWLTALIAVLIAFAAHRYLDIVEPNVNWGTASDALRYLRAVRALHALSRVKTDLITDVHHAKVFRPAYLACIPGGDPVPRAGPAVGLVSTLWRGRGLSVVAQVLQDDEVMVALHAAGIMGAGHRAGVAGGGHSEDDEDDDDACLEEGGRDAARRRADSVLQDASIKALASMQAPRPPAEAGSQVSLARASRRRISRMLDAVCSQSGRRAFFVGSAIHAPTFRLGVRSLMESSGVSALRSNTLVLEWPFDGTTAAAYKGVAQVHESVLDLCPGALGKASVPQLDAFEGTVCDALAGMHGVMIVRDPEGRFAPDSGNAAGDVWPEGDTIDLWWLDWDGGLALLVPWLLRQSVAFEGKKLRVFTSGSPDGVDNDATIAADERTLGLARLIALLRFDATPRSVKLNAMDASPEGVTRFSADFPGLLTKEELTGRSAAFSARALRRQVDEAAPAAATAQDTHAKLVHHAAVRAALSELSPDHRRRLAEITLWTIRAGELIRENSSSAATVFVVFPKPRRWFPLGIQSAWMETLSHSLPPTVLIRGTGATVVTDSS